MSNNATSNETDLDWLARNVHVWPEDAVYVSRHENAVEWHYVELAFKGLGHFTRDQWLARRAELQNKPSWRSVGSEINFISQHEDGQWIGHGEKPEEGDECFECDCIISLFGYGEVLGDWRNTLERRSEEFKQFTSIEDNQEQDMTNHQEMKQDNKWFERGELPPVGTECIFEPGDGKCYFNESELRAKGQKVTIIAHTKYKKGDGSVAVFQWDLNDCCGVSSANQNGFRPIRTEHEQLTSIIDGGKRVLAEPEAIADAILAAGFSLRAK